MFKKPFLYYFILFLTINFTWSQTLSNIDVLQYTHNLTVTDNNDTLLGVTEAKITFTKDADSFSLDLMGIDNSGKGMTVSSIMENGSPVSYTQNNDKLNISTSSKANDTRTYTISYSGVPADGLIISQNKYGDRTFFADNWPNRARNWVPCVDHPSDKALVTFKITAPSHYQVIANGTLTEETDLSNDNTYYVWKTNVAIPTKVMVIGIAKFAVQNIGETHNIPVASWVYPQEKEAGFYDLALTTDILNYFIETIGPYPYLKLSSVQSKTRFGGMENAGNIFYPEDFITGDRSREEIMAHEVAHQWFGNSATEADWPHIWLSEGFATYFENLYMENKYGTEQLKERLKSERKKVVKFAKEQYTPVVDFETQNLFRLLNRNTYEKGGWVLHMLRRKVGDDLFWESIQSYYNTYKLSNASTDDLRTVFETVTGKDLKPFFKQWLYTAGHPELTFKTSTEKKKFNITVLQKQEQIFTFPLEIKLIYENGDAEIKTISVSKKEETFSLPVKKTVTDFEIDPNVNLLFEKVD